MVQLSHPYMTIGKALTLTIWTFVRKVMSLLLNTLSRFVIDSLPKSKHLLISWLQSLSTVILEPKEIVCHCFHFFPFHLPCSDGTECHDLTFWNVEFQASFFTLSFIVIKRLFSSSSLSTNEWYHLRIRNRWYFSQQSWFQLVRVWVLSYSM